MTLNALYLRWSEKMPFNAPKHSLKRPLKSLKRPLLEVVRKIPLNATKNFLKLT